MIPTKEELAKKYNEYNLLYFNGKMKKLTKNNFFLIPKNNSNFGKYKYKIQKNGKIKNQIWIGTNVEWDEESLREVLIHEMIHMYNVTVEHSIFNGIVGHGFAFKRQCRRLKKEFGLKIHINPNFKRINGMKNPSFFEKILLLLINI